MLNPPIVSISVICPATAGSAGPVPPPLGYYMVLMNNGVD